MLYVIYFKAENPMAEGYSSWAEECLSHETDLYWNFCNNVSDKERDLYVIKGEEDDIESFLNGNFDSSDYEIVYVMNS